MGGGKFSEREGAQQSLISQLWFMLSYHLYCKPQSQTLLRPSKDK